FLSKKVSSRPRRSLNSDASMPVSNSWPRSACSLGLPGFNGMIPDATWFGPVRYGAARNVLSDAPAVGALPVVPKAARRRSDLIQSTEKNGSSDSTYDTRADGL